MSRQSERITRSRDGGGNRADTEGKGGRGSTGSANARSPYFTSLEEVPPDLLSRAHNKFSWIRQFVNLGYPSGRTLELARDHAERNNLPKVPASSTLYDWVDRYRRYGLLGLVDRVRKDAGVPETISEEQQRFLKTMVFARGDTSPARAINLLAKVFPQQPVPSRHAIRRFFKTIVADDSAAVEYARTGSVGIRTYHHTKIPGGVQAGGRILAMDSTSPDIWCQIPSGTDTHPDAVEPVRVYLTVVEDIGSRLIVTFNISLLPLYPELMVAVLRRAFLQNANWPGLVSVGVPDEVRVDAGKEFRGAFAEALAPLQLEINSASGNPNHNSHVERAIGSVNSEVCSPMEGYSRLEKPLDTLYTSSEREAKRTMKDLYYDPRRLEVPATSLPTVIELEEEILAWAQHHNARAHPAFDVSDPLVRRAIQNAEFTRLEREAA